MELSEGPAASSRGLPGPPWVPESSGGAGPGAGLEAEARGLSVTPWGTEGLLQWTSSVGLGAGVGEEAGGAGPKDMFWVVTGEVHGPPSTGTGTWARGLGDAVPLGWGAAGPAEVEVPEPRVLELSSAGSGLTCCGKGPAEARRFMASAGPKLVPTAGRRLPWGSRALLLQPPGGFSSPGPAHPSQTGRSQARAGEFLNPPGRAWVTSEPPSISAQSLVP